MKIEDQVVDRDRCIKLVDLGFKAETYHIWQRYEDVWYITDFTGDVNFLKSYPAPTIAELMFLLPASVDLEGTIYEFRMERTETYHNVCYWWDLYENPEDKLLVSINGTLREALADVLIFLIKEKHLKVEDLKL